jgi:hypothetical protein
MLREALMPRFVGKKAYGLWWDAIALVVLAIIVVVVLELTKTINLLSIASGPVFA